MSVADRARERGITEVLHYTSNRGVMGTIIKGALLSRERIETDPDVAFIYEGIWERKDTDWIDHISLSVSRINRDLYGRSHQRFPDYWWAVMSLDISILDHDGVWFTTTNNIYPPCLRGQGLDGFEAIFADSVAWGYYGSVKTRGVAHDAAWPTDRTAEILYPGRLPLEFLQALYVPSQEHRRVVNAWCETYSRPELPVEIATTPFQ